MLSVSFTGEEGIDAGICCDLTTNVDCFDLHILTNIYRGTEEQFFFEQLLEKVDQQFFEGKADRRLPKKEWCIEHSLEMAERIITHSIVQGGPGFPVLCPAVFNYTGLRLYCKRSSAQK